MTHAGTKNLVRTAIAVRRFDGTRTVTALLAGLLVLALTEPAFAQSVGGTGDITTFLQNIVNLITGTVGRLIAVLAICVVGIGALMGALSMRAAAGVVLGVILIFSSAWIVDQIVGM